MSGKLKKRQIKMLIGNFDDPMNEAIQGVIKKIIKGKYDILATSVWPGENILNFAKEHAIDIFIIVVNNIHFLSEKSSVKKPCEDGLQLISLLKKTYKKPIIALYGWPDDPLFPEKTKQAGANFCVKLPPEPKEIREAIEVCLGLKTHGNVVSFPSSNT
jgi:hypothetical protein